MDFATLKTRVEAILGRTPNSVVYDLVTADLNNSLRVVEMEATTTPTEAASVSLPADFLEVINVYRDTDPRVTLKATSETALHAQFQTSGTPTRYAVVDGALLLAPSPDGTETLNVRYYQKLANLSADADTNDVMSRFPGIYIYGALTHHAGIVRDENAARIYLSAYQENIRTAQAFSNRQRDGAVSSQPYVAHTP